MINFEDLKTQWAKQPEAKAPENGTKSIVVKINAMRKKQLITNIVLVATLLVLIGFFFYVMAYRDQVVLWGLVTMMGALLLRIVIEIRGVRVLSKLNSGLDVQQFKMRMIRFYQQRKAVHLVLTPLVLLAYCWGFVRLLPAFKANLSAGFYTYILVSSVVLIVFFTFFIGNHVRKELKILKSLKQT